MDVLKVLQDLSNAVDTAKAKADVVNRLRSELATYTASKQTEIDAAVTEYTDAKVAVDRLQAEGSAAIGAILPSPDPRYRVTT